MIELTPRQAEILQFLQEFHAAEDQLPTYHLIADRFDFASLNAASEHMKALERKGAIEKNQCGNWRFKREEELEGAA